MDKLVSSTYGAVPQTGLDRDRAVPARPAAGAPVPGTSRDEAMRVDHDGPDNVHPAGEPCKTKVECYRSFRLMTIFESPLREQQRANDYSKFWNKVVSRPEVIRHTADVSHVSRDGMLTVVVGPMPEEENQYSRKARTALEGRKEDYRLVLKGTVSDAIKRERELSGAPLKHVRIYSHATDGMIFEKSGKETHLTTLIRNIKPNLEAGAIIDIMGCSVANKQEIRELMQVAANKYNVLIRANGDVGLAHDAKPERHAYVFTPNPSGEMDYENTLIFADIRNAKQEALDKLRSSGGSR